MSPLINVKDIGVGIQDIQVSTTIQLLVYTEYWMKIPRPEQEKKMTYRISREQAQNFPVYSALDRARDRRNSIKENFEKEETERRQLEFKEKTDNLVKNLELDETLGQLLVAEGFSSIDEIHKASLEEISKIEGIDENTAKELKDRAGEFLIEEKENIQKKLKDLGVDDN